MHQEWALSAHGFAEVYRYCYTSMPVASWAHWTARDGNHRRASPGMAKTLVSLRRLSAALLLFSGLLLLRPGGRPVLCQRSPWIFCPVRGAEKPIWSYPAKHDYLTFQDIAQETEQGSGRIPDLSVKGAEKEEGEWLLHSLFWQGMLTWQKHSVASLHTVTPFPLSLIPNCAVGPKPASSPYSWSSEDYLLFELI